MMNTDFHQILRDPFRVVNFKAFLEKVIHSVLREVAHEVNISV